MRGSTLRVCKRICRTWNEISTCHVLPTVSSVRAVCVFLWLLAAQGVRQSDSIIQFGSKCRDQLLSVSRRLLWESCHPCVLHPCPAATEWDGMPVSHIVSVWALSGPRRPFPFGVAQWCPTLMTAPFIPKAAVKTGCLTKVFVWRNSVCARVCVCVYECLHHTAQLF